MFAIFSAEPVSFLTFSPPTVLERSALTLDHGSEGVCEDNPTNTLGLD